VGDWKRKRGEIEKWCSQRTSISADENVSARVENDN
jgi:hypothetical protein